MKFLSKLPDWASFTIIFIFISLTTILCPCKYKKLTHPSFLLLQKQEGFVFWKAPDLLFELLNLLEFTNNNRKHIKLMHKSLCYLYKTPLINFASGINLYYLKHYKKSNWNKNYCKYFFHTSLWCLKKILWRLEGLEKLLRDTTRWEKIMLIFFL